MAGGSSGAATAELRARHAATRSASITLMVPYSHLTGAARERDRNTVREYPKRLDEAGYRAVWL